MEGLPISLLEAMSYGCCVVTSDIPENIEVVGHFGFTFKNKNSLDLKHVLGKMLASPDEVNQVGHTNRQIVRQKYNWDTIADQTLKVYESLYH